MTCLYPCLSYISYLRLWVSIQPKVQYSANVSMVLIQVGTAWVRTHQPPCDTDSCYNRSGFRGRGWARCVWNRATVPALKRLRQTGSLVPPGPAWATQRDLVLEQGSKRTNKNCKSRLDLDGQEDAWQPDWSSQCWPHLSWRASAGCQMRQTVLSHLPLSLLGKGLISGRSKSRRRFSIFSLLGQLLLSEKKMQTLAYARKDVCVFLIYIFKYINIAICKGDKGEIKEVFLRVFTRM